MLLVESIKVIRDIVKYLPYHIYIYSGFYFQQTTQEKDMNLKSDYLEE